LETTPSSSLLQTGSRIADLTYVAIAFGFVYLAVILDAWSRRVIGYAIGRAIDTRLTIAVLWTATTSTTAGGCTRPRLPEPHDL
jgi:transposase InsO family protein